MIRLCEEGNLINVWLTANVPVKYFIVVLFDYITFLSTAITALFVVNQMAGRQKKK